MWTTRGHYVSQEGPSCYIEGTLQFCDFNQGSTSRKMLLSKRHADGLEAPRNSLELTTETSKSYHMVHENIPLSLLVKQQPIKRHFHHPGGVTMKKLIDKEMSSNTTRHSAPSVIARLMGMDTLPSEGKQPIHSNDHENENSRSYLPRKNNTEEASHYKQLRAKSFKQKKQELFAYGVKQDTNGRSRSPRLTKPHRREHPQEELLQKFKKEFEAWQTAKVWERSRAVGLDDSYLKGRNSQTPALENFEKQKKALHANTERNQSHRKSEEYLTSSTAILGTKSQRSSSQHKGYMSKEGLPNLVGTINSRNRTKFNDSVPYPELKFREKQDRSSSPTRIVILKPSSERTEIEESWPCSGEVLEREGSMEYFLEEVREKLRLEIRGKARDEIRTSKCSGEIPFSEKLTDPKQIAQHIAKQIRESVTRDLGTTLMRSESTRSYRSESQPNGPDSPEFINRNTRKLLCERLRNVLRDEPDIGINTISNGKLRPPSIVKEMTTLRQLTDSPKLGKSSYSEHIKDVTEMNTTLSFREEQVNNEGCSAGDLSPRNFVRSLSAPVSGTTFGKLLLEDQNVLAGIHIQRKHESTENTSVEVRKIRKDVFNFKGRVSNLRHNLTLRGKLFGRKMTSVDESGGKRVDSIKGIATSPSVVMNLGIAQENSTEVPPSPASLSSSSYDELCKPSHPSPVSPLEMSFTEDHPSLEISGEIGSTLPEVQAQSEPTEIAGFEETSIAEEVCDATDVECQEEAYLRDVLITARLYDKPLDIILTPCNAVTKPIAESVFEEVEAAYARYEKMNDDMCPSQTIVCRKILFDLLNEELFHVLSLPISSSILKRCLGSTRVLQGRKLLEDVWQRLEICLQPPVDKSGSLESLVAYDLRMTTWSKMLLEDIDVVGGDLEYMILLELVDEVVSDMWC